MPGRFSSFKRARTQAWGLLVFAVALLSWGGGAGAGDVTPAKLLVLANQSRAEAELPPLKANPALAAAAKAKAEDMFENDYFAHTSPKGVAPWHWIKEAGYRYQVAGENLAINFSSAEAQHKAWMKSKTHRANILNARYQEIGMAVQQGKIDGKSATVTVVLFGTPVPGAVVPQASEPKPEPKPAPAVEGVEAVRPDPQLVQPAGASPVATAPQFVVPVKEVSLPRWYDWAWMGSILLIQLGLIVLPVNLLWRAFCALARAMTAFRESVEHSLEHAVATANRTGLFEHRLVHAHAVHGRLRSG